MALGSMEFSHVRRVVYYLYSPALDSIQHAYKIYNASKLNVRLNQGTVQSYLPTSVI